MFNEASGLYHLPDCLYAQRCRHCKDMTLSEASGRGRMCYICQQEMEEP